ncbi:MAG: MBL fold metallo-hydrolase [Chloroflexota bacterium]|nr:MBL fold metallo-hydrolase [Chloroflexota bacterium]
MTAKMVVPGVYRVPLGPVNAFLIDHDGLTLIDTGIPGSAGKILDAVRDIGKKPADIRQILLTHAHADHTGSLAALKRELGVVATYMHSLDAELLRQGVAGRPVRPAPGLFNRLFYTAFFARQSGMPKVEPAEVEHIVEDGSVLPVAGGFQVIHIPGHCAGQVAFLWPEQGGVMFAADAASNMFGLAYSPIYEDLALGRRSLRKLGKFKFEVACFGHGKPITEGAAERFARRWPSAPR